MKQNNYLLLRSVFIVNKHLIFTFLCCCSFFLEAESVGKSRAAVALRLLLELNPDVHGDSVDEDVDQVLVNNPDFFNSFHVVIGTALSERYCSYQRSFILKLSTHCPVTTHNGFDNFQDIDNPL